MTVKELMAQLENLNPDAEVRLSVEDGIESVIGVTYGPWHKDNPDAAQECAFVSLVGDSQL